MHAATDCGSADISSGDALLAEAGTSSVGRSEKGNFRDSSKWAYSCDNGVWAAEGTRVLQTQLTASISNGNKN